MSGEQSPGTSDVPPAGASDDRRKIDLHTHSTASDGLFSPSELVQRAADAGLTTLALCDHDSTEGVDEAMEAGERLGVEVIPAVEMNTTLPDDLGEAHILGYFVDYQQPAFSEALRTIREARERRGQRMVERLHEHGLPIPWERVRALAGGSVGRPHVAQALVEAGAAESVADAFDRYLSPGKPGYVPRYRLGPTDALKLIRSARGVVVLAHPARIPDLRPRVLPELVMAGLQGLECYYGQYDDATVDGLLDLAGAYRLIPTGGSDYHGPNIHPTPLGGRYVPPEIADRLRAMAAFLHTLPAPRFTLPPLEG